MHQTLNYRSSCHPTRENSLTKTRNTKENSEITGMGSCQTKNKKSSSPSERAVEGLKNKVRLLQGEINEIMCLRETESQVYERELMALAFKQAEWKRDRKRLKEEVKKLRKIFEEREERMRWIEEERGRDELELAMGTTATATRRCHVLEERTRRDETVEKWKQLYFAVKVELDDLIQRTHQEQRLCWNTGEEEEEVFVELHKELKANEKRIKFLQTKLASMEHQESKRERQMDILRQSLRIMSHKKKATKLGQRPIQEF